MKTNESLPRLIKLGGLLLERFHRVRVLAVSYFCSGVFTGLLPWCASLELLIGVMLLNGINMGMVDTGKPNQIAYNPYHVRYACLTCMITQSLLKTDIPTVLRSL